MELISFYGNEIVKTSDVRKIERLKSQGFKEVEPIKKDIPKKEGEVKNATRKGKARTETNI